MTEPKAPPPLMAPLETFAPAPITKWRTSDGKEHDSEDDAIAHETFLAIKGDIAIKATDTPYEVIITLARKFHFVRRPGK